MFEIHDDIEVLKRMGMAYGLEAGKCSPEDLKVARGLVPKALEPYVTGESSATVHLNISKHFCALTVFNCKLPRRQRPRVEPFMSENNSLASSLSSPKNLRV